jgi:hypothetical protein
MPHNATNATQCQRFSIQLQPLDDHAAKLLQLRRDLGELDLLLCRRLQFMQLVLHTGQPRAPLTHFIEGEDVGRVGIDQTLDLLLNGRLLAVDGATTRQTGIAVLPLLLGTR